MIAVLIIVLKALRYALVLYNNVCNVFLILIFFALFFMFPIMCYVRFCPKCLEKIFCKNIKFCEKLQLAAMFFPLCERAEPHIRAPIALPPSKLEK